MRYISSEVDMHLMLPCRVFVLLFSLSRCSPSTSDSVARWHNFQLTPAGGNQCPSTGCTFKGLTTRSRTQCAAECDLSPKCSGFSYYTSSRSCYLYDFLPTVFSFNSDCNFMKDTNAVLDSNSATAASRMKNWTVIMNRFDGSVDFNLDWTDYRNGFGDKEGGEFWLGNEEVHRLTCQFNCTLRIEIQRDSCGCRYYAEYSTFSLESESNKYTLRLSGYSGTALDSLTNTSMDADGYHGGMGFTTRDNDNDRSSDNCALDFPGGWWFNHCLSACLTCQYGNDFYWSIDDDWPSYGHLRTARMMIRSK